jgi:hypothetical protein
LQILFSINREDSSCRTPRRNAEIASALEFSQRSVEEERNRKKKVREREKRKRKRKRKRKNGKEMKKEMKKEN